MEGVWFPPLHGHRLHDHRCSDQWVLPEEGGPGLVTQRRGIEGGKLETGPYWSEDKDTQEKIERLADLREKYRYQRRLWRWGILLSIFTLSFFVRQPTALTLLLGVIALGAGVLSTWSFFQCSRAIRMMDKALAPYRVKEKS